MIDRERLAAKCAARDILLTPACLEQLDIYAEMLVDYNQHVNLTAITDPEGIEDKHFLDSLLFASQPEVAGSLVDVGTGAGFPGLVARIYKPELAVTLMEPTGKRAARKQWREQFDLACARAVSALPQLAEFCLPLVKPGGKFIALKGASAQEELDAAAGAIRKLGGRAVELRRLRLPAGDERALVICEKISQTPSAYPRNGGKIAKSPLK